MTGKSEIDRQGIPNWLWLIGVIIPLFLLFRWLFWWLLCPSQERTSAVEIDTPRSPATFKPPVEDDLTRIKGIGPKVSRALTSAGIRSFRQLALTNERQLKTILKDANASIVNPSTWSDQAKLAAQGAWEQLEAFQRDI